MGTLVFDQKPGKEENNNLCTYNAISLVLSFRILSDLAKGAVKMKYLHPRSALICSLDRQTKRTPFYARVIMKSRRHLMNFGVSIPEVGHRAPLEISSPYWLYGTFALIG